MVKCRILYHNVPSSRGHGRFPKCLRHKTTPARFSFSLADFFIVFWPWGCGDFPVVLCKKQQRAILRVFSKFHIGLTNYIMHHLRGNLKYWRGLTTVAYWFKDRFIMSKQLEFFFKKWKLLNQNAAFVLVGRLWYSMVNHFQLSLQRPFSQLTNG